MPKVMPEEGTIVGESVGEAVGFETSCNDGLYGYQHRRGYVPKYAGELS